MAAALFVLGAFAAMDAAGSRWDVRTDFELLTDYTGNVFLDVENTEEELILRARPRIRVERAGARASVDFDYIPEFRYFTQGTQANRLVHIFNGSANVELVRNLFGLKASARAGENVVNGDLGFGFDGLTNPDNVTETYSMTVTPYLLPIRFGRYAQLEISSDLDIVNYSDADLRTSRGRTLNTRLNSGPAFSPFIWGLRASIETVDYDDADDGSRDEYEASVGYQIDRAWTVAAAYGLDTADVGSASVIDNEPRWSVGVTWTPHSRASARLSVGERFGDADYGFEFNYRHKRSCWYGLYDHELTSARNDILGNGFFKPGSRLCTVREDLSQQNDQLGLSLGPPLNTREAIAKRFRAGFNWLFTRTTVDLAAQHEVRDYLASTDGETNYGLFAGIERRLTPRSALSASAVWFDHAQDSAPEFDYRQYSATLNYRYRLSRTANLIFGYRITSRDGSESTDYSEDRLSLSLVSNYE